LGDLWSLVRRLSPCFSPCYLCLVHDPYLFPTHCLMSLVLFQVMFYRFLLAPMSSMLWPSSVSYDILYETYVPFALLLLWYLGRTPHVHNLRIRFYLVAPILPERLNAWVSIPDHCDLSILVHSFVPPSSSVPLRILDNRTTADTFGFHPKALFWASYASRRPSDAVSGSWPVGQLPHPSGNLPCMSPCFSFVARALPMTPQP